MGIRQLLAACLFPALLIFSSCGQDNKALPEDEQKFLTRTADLVVTGSYSKYKKVFGLEPFDALEMGGKRESPKIEYLVVFKLQDILKGEYYQTGSGAYYQERKPDEKTLIRIGVMSPSVFGIYTSTPPAERLYTIYLKYYPEGSGYYRVIGSEWKLKERYKNL
jgi:hypothetical protein